ncbi:hypothetical protein KIN20_019814 [Parelaphostrongylus tenuis]|uniref:Uncharacterized protein n=1 Tax=Parelaphostrongylus tenuis TaxID=148309 RepID=A0AAD5QT82_PARTN|nr:hypothetical protein KIN20_019814 [Parelaphostrongylus tenuis]
MGKSENPSSHSRLNAIVLPLLLNSSVLFIDVLISDDSGIYSCHGLSPFDDSPSLHEDDHPKVYYSLVVHAPSDVHLEMNQNVRDKSWQLSCYVKNLRYEIPMVYVNGTTLIDAIGQMGVASSTNFYSNPVNATIRIRSNYSGSVQCISRPAMDEAEVYGSGLERGRSHNLYVVSSPSSDHLIKQGPVNVTATIGDDVELICLVIQRVNSKYWLKDGSYVPFGAARTQRVGSNSLKIHKVEKKDEGWYTCVVVGEGSEKSEQQAYLSIIERTTASPFPTSTEFYINKKKNDFVTMEDVRGFVTGPHVRIQWSVIGKMEALTSVAGFKIELQTESALNDSWIEADSVDSHVRATTIKDLVPNNKYRFRVKLVKDDGSSFLSETTSWMTVNLPIGDTLPMEPEITSSTMLNSTSVKLTWIIKAVNANAKPRHYIVTYAVVNSMNSQMRHVGGNDTEVIIDGLQANETYEFSVTAENHAGKGSSSSKVTVNMARFNDGLGFIRFFSRYVGRTFSLQSLALIVIGILLTLFVLLICCVVCCSFRGQNRDASLFKSANGKFLDTSYRIFNEQKVHKSRIGDDAVDLYGSDFIDERSPLKAQQDENSSTVRKKFHFSDVLPNLYGIDDNALNNDCEDATYDPTCLITGAEVCEAKTLGCHTPDSDTSHEILFSHKNSAIFSSPQMSTSQRLAGYRCPNSLFSSSAGTASSLTDTTSSGLVSTQLACDSPLNQPTDGSDQGVRYVSRNSQVSSTDGQPKVPLQTFKSTYTTFLTSDSCGQRGDTVE